MTMHLVTQPRPCNLCGASKLRRTYHVHGYHLGACEGCGLWRLEPQPTAGALYAYYQRDYYRHREWAERAELPTIMRLSEGKMAPFRDSLKRIERLVSGRRLLDVGCAFGQFLCVARGEGFIVEGVELDPLLARRANDFGVTTYSGDFLSCDSIAGTYDAITFWYVLEHVTAPLDYLRKSWGLLRPGGVVYIRVPNMNFGLPFLLAHEIVGLRVLPSILSHIPAHLFFYTPGTLRLLVAKAGFAIEWMDHGPPVCSQETDWSDRLGNRLRWLMKDVADGIKTVSRNKIWVSPYLSLYGRKSG